VNLTEWGKSVKVAPDEDKFASTWLWSSFSNLWRAYKIIIEIHTQQNSPHGFTVYSRFYLLILFVFRPAKFPDRELDPPRNVLLFGIPTKKERRIEIQGNWPWADNIFLELNPTSRRSISSGISRSHRCVSNLRPKLISRVIFTPNLDRFFQPGKC